MTGTFPWLVLAQGADDLVQEIHPPKSGLAQTLIIAGSLFVVISLAAAWLILFRKKHHRHEHHWRRREVSAADGPGTPAESGQGKERRRKRQRPRNPTLAETRGLPPVRDEPPARTPPY